MENVTVREEIEPDVALYGLSRRKQGFETPTGRHFFDPSAFLPYFYPISGTGKVARWRLKS
jgi:hypothetical protein